MGFVPISRMFTAAMAGVICFGLIVPLALSRHNTVLAGAVAGFYIAYLAVNVVLWKRMRT